MKTMYPPGYHHNGFVATHALGNMVYCCHKAIVVITERALCFHLIWYKRIHFSLLLNPAIQRMGNTHINLHPRCMEQDESHPHFIFSCKLSKVTLDYIGELINLNYSFNPPFKFSPKTIKMGFFSIL